LERKVFFGGGNMEPLEEKKKLITYCGGFCGSCGGCKGRIVSVVAKDFRESIVAYFDWIPEYEKGEKGLCKLHKKALFTGA
jgi:hypothetical protein